MRRSLAFSFLLPLLATSCATQRGSDGGDTAPERAAETLHDLARRAIHLDNTDVSVDQLARIGDVTANAFRSALLRNTDESGQLDPVTRAWLDKLRASSARAFAGSELREALVDSIVAADKGHLPAVAAWLEEPLHQRIANARARVATPEGQAALGHAIARIAGEPPDPQRLTYVRTLHEAANRVDLFLAVSFDASSDLMAAMRPSLPAGLRDGDPSDEEQAAARAGFHTRVQRTLLLQGWFALRELSDGDLLAARAFWSSDPGRWYATTRVRGLRLLSLSRAQAVAEALADAPSPPAAPTPQPATPTSPTADTL
jgi:hypothetical protein